MASSNNLTETSLFSRFVESQQNQTNSTLKDDTNPFMVHSDSVAEIVLVWGIFTFFFGSLIGIMAVDMVRKHRTGELQESGRNIASLGLLVLKAPFMLFSRKNMSAVWTWFTDLFRSAENKKRKSKMDAVSLDRRFDHEAVISRLSVKPSTLETETRTTSSDSDNARRLAGGGSTKDTVPTTDTTMGTSDSSAAIMQMATMGAIMTTSATILQQ
ncbi:hypothetical protein B0J13DRAFT_61338 [Dactylonectria estremocensis]|uniref:Uncharacterized protein n=1 Tax=Dactylonectria estremocensis TaxID=1079267 RepID=A0A9P9IY53_9HYPO|nr:hypothetical protein B0J13DRAFT_61338 [Dactylonectria estremocensis]